MRASWVEGITAESLEKNDTGRCSRSVGAGIRIRALTLGAFCFALCFTLSATAAEDFAPPPDEVKWQRGSERYLTFKAKLCDREVTYCYTHVTKADGGTLGALCRSQEVKDADGKVTSVCPEKAEDCGTGDSTMKPVGSGEEILSASATGGETAPASLEKRASPVHQ